MTAVCSAVKTPILVCLLWAVTQLAWAEAGSILSLVGTVSAQRQDGTTRILAKGSKIDAGDILLTEKGSLVRVRFIDGTQITLRAASRFVIEAYHYVEDQPKDDKATFNLIKGGMRAATGLISKRGDPEALRTSTVVATAGVRGTDYGLTLCAEADESCSDLTVPPDLMSNGKPAAGLYLSVFEGTIYVANNAASKDFAEGMSGYVRDINTPPVELQEEPGLLRQLGGFDSRPNVATPLENSAGACLVK